ncbi:MAG TPA: ribonuclease J [Miltoncostaeaceae bacterium]|nr:ribonuclease J [Miltoncostaeaceae bacterium]
MSTGTAPAVRVIPLGGTGEIGRNMYVVEHQDRMVIIDCGVTFPKPDQLGVDLVLPDFGYVEENRDRLEAVILTHGHEDHIGALPYLVRAIGEVRVIGPRFALGLVRAKLDEHRLVDRVELQEAAPGPGPQLGPFRTEFVRLTHSIPDCVAVVLHTDAGTVVHTGDFKFDHTPVAGAPRADVATLARLGEEGVLLLLADSTNAEEAPEPQNEAQVGQELRRVLATAAGRVVITTFSSHIHRVQQVLEAAYDDGRVVALVGRSLLRNVGIATNLGVMRTPPQTLVKIKDLEEYRPDETVIVCTGSQGEYMAALSRMARGEHHQVELRPSDTIVFSSRTVPGNELAVNETINRIVRLGARFITGRSHPGIHVSGHGTSADLLWMLQLLRPRYFAPIHGEARHQRAHSDLARAVEVPGENIFRLENGDVLEVTPESCAIVDHIPAGVAYVDGLGVGDATAEVMRDRRHLADDGVLVLVATVDADSGALVGQPEVIARGFPNGDDPEVVEETVLAVERSLQESAEQRVTEIGVLQHRLHDAVAAMLRKRTGRRPMVLPVIVEV